MCLAYLIASGRSLDYHLHMLATLVLMSLSSGVALGRRVPAKGVRPHMDVPTTQGVVRGYLAGDPPHYAFLGLPYGRPPTYQRRFKAPEPPLKWDGILEATYRIKCVQPDGSGDENCLVLNVFRPEQASGAPVLVHVHGGGFQSGWGNFQPPGRLLREGFIFVTINFRLGALGFLCLGTENAPGNAGLKDQVAALYWVHRNIAHFGGNPGDITLYGTDSGAASVELLSLSESTKGLFHKIIMESGSALSPSSMSHDPLSDAVKSAKMLKYNGTGNLNELYIFYRKLKIKEIGKVSELFLPCVESNPFYLNTLMEGDPLELLNQGSFIHVPTMLAYSNNFGDWMITQNSQQFSNIPDDFKSLLPNNLDFENFETKQKVSDLIKNFYFDEFMSKDKIIESFANYINDIFIIYPVVKSALLHSMKSTESVYLLSYESKSQNKEVNGKRVEHENPYKAAIYNYFTDVYVNEEREAQAKIFVTLWTNFIKLGDPTPLTTPLVPVVWQPVNTDMTWPSSKINKALCLVFSKQLQMTTPPSAARLEMWDQVYQKYTKVHSSVNNKLDDDEATNADESSEDSNVEKEL